MRYPNLRYGNPTEFAHYVDGIPISEVAKRLRRSERSVSDWLTCRKRIPWWVPEIVRLQHLEHSQHMREMGLGAVRAKLGLVSGDVIAFPTIRPARAIDSSKQPLIQNLVTKLDTNALCQ